ncbi:hypothetical protein [Halorussus salinisoli]|uniref:hypothetical protein n=1 Tax=Halorussus salinisoli TaxID=2558242 RepID=UPI0010C164B5|nr:hypothetical protein [Halorussus salinisoli]
MTVQEDTKQLEVPARIVSQIETRLSRTEFDSPEEYITYVLEEVLYHLNQQTENDEFEAVDEAEVKDRLQTLGYLDTD